MTSKRAKDYWNLGVPLNRAWRDFAPSPLSLQYAQLPGFLDSIEQVAKTDVRQDFLRDFANATKSSLAKMHLEKEMKDAVLTDLFNEELIATGFREFPSRSQSPVVIDSTKFEADDPDWKRDTFEIHGIRYGQIRVCFSETFSPVELTAKGSKAVIEQAIENLINANPDFANLPRQNSCQKIRDYLGAKEISGNGMSDKNLSKAIVKICGSRRIIDISN